MYSPLHCNRWPARYLKRKLFLYYKSNIRMCWHGLTQIWIAWILHILAPKRTHSLHNNLEHVVASWVPYKFKGHHNCSFFGYHQEQDWHNGFHTNLAMDLRWKSSNYLVQFCFPPCNIILVLMSRKLFFSAEFLFGWMYTVVVWLFRERKKWFLTRLHTLRTMRTL